MTDIFNLPQGTFRIVFLHVGQGDATLMMIPDGEQHKFILIDSNKSEDGVDIANLLKDQIPNGELIFINTHPHNDHVRGIDEVKDLVGEVWETGFEPSSKHDDAKKTMDDLVSERNVYYLRGTRQMNILSENGTEEGKDPHKIGDVDYQVLSPASYVADEVNGDDDNIHAQCGVIKFTYKNKSILMTGDSDKEAWVEHITPYYNDLLDANVLSASHHGSRSFFKDGEDDENSFKGHIEKINPEYLVISAPKESQFDHPHDDAMKIYREYVSEDKIFNLGEKEQSLVVDIDLDGNLTTEWFNCIKDETEESNKTGSLATLYPYKPSGNSNIKPYCTYEN
jgi:competence protein ComEC